MHMHDKCIFTCICTHARTHKQLRKHTQGLAAQLEKLSLKPAPFISQPRFWEDEGISVYFYVSKITIANSQAQKIYRYLCRAPISERERARAHTHTHTHTHTHMHSCVEFARQSESAPREREREHARTHTHTHTYTHTHTCIHI
jgi:hypothetical protein